MSTPFCIALSRRYSLTSIISGLLSFFIKGILYHPSNMLYTDYYLHKDIDRNNRVIKDSPLHHGSSYSEPTFPVSASNIPTCTPPNTRHPGRYRSGPECRSPWSCAPCEDRFPATRAALPWSAASDTRHLRGSPASAWKNKYLFWDYGPLFSLSRFLIALRSPKGKRDFSRESPVKRKIVANACDSNFPVSRDAFTDSYILICM